MSPRLLPVHEPPLTKEWMVVVHCRDGDTFAGPYSFDKETETVKGCPARSSMIKSYIKVIGSKSGAKGAASAIRHHAEAMKIEELKKIIQWSETQYPSEMSAAEPKDINELMLAVEHTMMRAFMTTGFTLWTRYREPSSSVSGTLIYRYPGTLSLPVSKHATSSTAVRAQHHISTLTSRYISKITRDGSES